MLICEKVIPVTYFCTAGLHKPSLIYALRVSLWLFKFVPRSLEIAPAFLMLPPYPQGAPSPWRSRENDA